MTSLRDETRGKYVPNKIYQGVIATNAGGNIGVVAGTAEDMLDRISVIIPALDENLLWEDCRWQSRDNVTLPQKGDECLAIFDDTGELWVVAWWAMRAGVSLITGDLVWSVLTSRKSAVLCDGALYNSVTDYTFQPLFAAIGTSYGGTGPASFAVPDVRGRLLISRGTNADVNVLGKNDGDANVANRSPIHQHPSAGLTWSGSWSGSFAGNGDSTGYVSSDHAHYSNFNSSGRSADHAHTIPAFAGGGNPPNQMMGQWYSSYLGENVGTYGENVDHLHAVQGWSGGISANHTHAYTPSGGVSGSVSGSVGGTVGTTGPHPTNTPSYIVENCFIIK